MVLVGLAVAGASVLLFNGMKRELAPIEDRATIVAHLQRPRRRVDRLHASRYAQEIERLAQSVPEVDRVFVVTGSPTVTQGIAFFRLVDWARAQRARCRRSSRELQPKLLGIPGVLAFAVAPASLGQSPRERPINFVVLTSESYEEMQQTLRPLMAELQARSGACRASTATCG